MLLITRIASIIDQSKFTSSHFLAAAVLDAHIPKSLQLT